MTSLPSTTTIPYHECEVNCCAQGHFDINCVERLKHFIIQILPCGPVIGTVGTKGPLDDLLQLYKVDKRQNSIFEHVEYSNKHNKGLRLIIPQVVCPLPRHISCVPAGQICKTKTQIRNFLLFHHNLALSSTYIGSTVTYLVRMYVLYQRLAFLFKKKKKVE